MSYVRQDSPNRIVSSQGHKSYHKIGTSSIGWTQWIECVGGTGRIPHDCPPVYMDIGIDRTKSVDIPHSALSRNTEH